MNHATTTQHHITRTSWKTLRWVLYSWLITIWSLGATTGGGGGLPSLPHKMGGVGGGAWCPHCEAYHQDQRGAGSIQPGLWDRKHQCRGWYIVSPISPPYPPPPPFKIYVPAPGGNAGSYSSWRSILSHREDMSGAYSGEFPIVFLSSYIYGAGTISPKGWVLAAWGCACTASILWYLSPYPSDFLEKY